MPNTFAYIMLIAWPFFSLFLYKRYDVFIATSVTVIAGFMFLPVRTFVDLPALPPFGKQEVIALSCLLGSIVTQQKVFFLGVHTTQRILIGLILVFPIINVLFNSEPMFNGELWVKGLSLYDAFQQVVIQYLIISIFLVGMNAVKSAHDLRRLFVLLTVAGMLYVPLVLLEIRLSPQLHTWLYGFFPSGFDQQFRYGGFRSAAFIGHGLLVSTFLLVCCAAAYSLFINTNSKNRPVYFICFFVLLVTTILNKSLSALVFLIPILLIITLQSSHIYKRTINVGVSVFILYPLLASLSLIPYDSIVGFVNSIDLDRGQSLDFRFMHEELIVAHAQEKFFIGWGSWSRNRFFDSITDGYWLIVFSTYGVIAFWALFGLTLQPLIKMALQKNVINTPYSFGLGLVLAVLLLDQIPNSSFSSSFLWFLSGCLAGYVFRHTHVVQNYERLA